MTMRIAQVAPPSVPVPPARYGGTERVISVLTEELVRRGHEVTLFASGDSRTSARLVPVVDSALWYHPRYRDSLPIVLAELELVYSRADEFDVIHAHLDYLPFSLARRARTPTVTTLHGRLDLPELQFVFRAFPEARVVSISNNQRRPLPFARWVGTIYNGIDVSRFTLERRRGSYLVFLGRFSPEKRVDAAVEVARRSGIPLKIAARPPLEKQLTPNDVNEWRYFEEVVKPLLSDPIVEYVGEVDDRGKDELLRGALALIHPCDWPEPFGLALVEAMACGTPVIARRTGSVPEIVDDGRTGFVCDSIEEMVLACDRVGEIDRALCRQVVEQRFSAKAMADGYEAVYRRAIADAGLPALAATNGHQATEGGTRLAGVAMIASGDD